MASWLAIFVELIFMKSDEWRSVDTLQKVLPIRFIFRNHSEKSINSILDYISTSKQMELLQNFYETTLEALRDAKVQFLRSWIILFLVFFTQKWGFCFDLAKQERLEYNRGVNSFDTAGSISISWLWKFLQAQFPQPGCGKWKLSPEPAVLTLKDPGFCQTKAPIYLGS